MQDLRSLNHTEFARCLNQTFTLDPGVPGEVRALPLVLIEVTEHGSGAAGPHRRQPFCVLFRGPALPVLPQRTYVMNHDSLGRLEIFLVPLGPDGQGMRYEAVFT
ncbi:hypothetical protein [uncultured Thiodictyon sp.]|jgi:hypothetical protein|uniref:DUF6916 family protein n=1 Tax=uncultured Thiodictyon sp. TaxID=1846217 RepID=UPI0025E108B7|nr:hypothetical protein [uncultured Thiodictyon sp.]